MFVHYYRFIRNSGNPDQDPFKNLPKAAATYAVGGMITHWTSCTPRQHPKIERSNLLTNEEWDKLYTEGETMLKTNQKMFEHSIRNTVVKEALREAYPDLTDEKDMPQSLPLAGERNKAAPEFINWSGGDTILGDDLINMLGTPKSKFALKVKPLHIYMASYNVAMYKYKVTYIYIAYIYLIVENL